MAEMIRSEDSDSSGTNESRGGHFSGEVRDKHPSHSSSRKCQSTQGNESHKARRRKVKAATYSDNSDNSGSCDVRGKHPSHSSSRKQQSLYAKKNSKSCDVRGKQSSHSSSRKRQSLYAKKSSKSSRRKGQVSTSSDSDSSSGDEVKAALESHYDYLRKNLRVDNELAAKLYGWSPQLLGDPPYGEIRSLNNQGKHYDAFEKWFSFATSYYTEESVGVFCKCLKEAGREGRPRLTKVARKTLKKVPNRGCPDSPPLSSGNSPQPGHRKVTNPHVEKLREHACDQYKLLKIGDGIKMEYIKLTLLSANLTVRGKNRDLNDFLQHYRTCGVEPLEAGFNVQPTKLLCRAQSKVRIIYGHAGIGKTSLLKQVCRALAEEEADSDYELVLYFPLRDKLVSQAKTLKELLSYYYSEDENLDHSAQSLRGSKGRNALFVFDGADEVRELLESEDTRSSAFRRILHGKDLPEAHVIVTSRPGGIPHLQKLVPEFYEIRGFDKASIESYISEFFKDDPEEGVKMLKELRSRADLIGGAHIPVNLFIFCSIYRDGGFPTTITLCYEQFTCHVMSRNSPKPFHFDQSFQSLPDNEQELLKALGKLAYEGLMKTPPIFVFERKELCQVFPILVTSDESMNETFFRGLLHHDSSMQGFLENSTYNFSHTTNQEFFAAFFVSKLPEEEQLAFLAEHFTNPKYSMVVRFYSGLTGLSSERITSFLCQPDHQSPSSHTLFSLHLLSYQRWFTQDNPHLLFLCHSLYESQNSFVTENIVKHLSNSLTFHLSHTSHDLLALRYTLGKCTHLKWLNFSPHTHEIPSLSEIFPILTSNRSLEYLKLRVENLSSEDGRNLSSMASLETLYLTVRERTTLPALSAIFSSSTIKDLNLGISCPVTDITHEHKSELSRLVSVNTVLKKLTLRGGSQDYMSSVLHGLGTSTGSITDLVVKCDKLSVEDGSNLSSVASLKTLYLTVEERTLLSASHLNVGEGTTLSALSAIFSSSTIKDLNLRIHCPVTDITHEHKLELSRLVSANTVLKKLTLRGGSQDYMSAVLHGLGTSAGSITDLVVVCDELSVEGRRVVGEALATTCAANVNLKQVSMTDLPPLTVMKSLTNQRAPLDELKIMYSWTKHKAYPDCSVESLKEMERAAAEIKAVKIVFDVDSNPHVCRAVSAGFGGNSFLKDLTLWNVPGKMKESTKTELSASIEAVRMRWSLEEDYKIKTI